MATETKTRMTALSSAIDAALDEIQSRGEEAKASVIADLALSKMDKKARDEAILVGASMRARYRLRARQNRKVSLEERVQDLLATNPDASDEELAALIRDRTAVAA